MDERKVNAIMDWARPKSVSELRSFLGLANYYQKVIQGYSRRVAPLTDLLKRIKSGHVILIKRNLRNLRLR